MTLIMSGNSKINSLMLKLNGIKNKQLKRFAEHSIYLAITLLLLPGFIYFENCVVAPAVVGLWSISHFIHLFCGIFLFYNIVGNMFNGMFTETSIKGRYLHPSDAAGWTLCSVCECLRPPRAWHCDMCDICILKRDHHCTFFACCVGYYNHRYFMLFTFYTCISMIYAFIYNVMFLSQTLHWNEGWVLLKFVFPLVSFVLLWDWETVYASILIVNFTIGVFNGFLFIFHFHNLMRGKVTYENKLKKNVIYDNGWKNNLIEVFGDRWYLTWISPFIKSQLPGDGIHWNIIDKDK